MTKKAKNFIGVLSWQLLVSHQNPMAAPRIVIEFTYIIRHTGPYWIEVDITDQFEEVGLFFAYDGFIPVLEKVT